MVFGASANPSSGGLFGAPPYKNAGGLFGGPNQHSGGSIFGNIPRDTGGIFSSHHSPSTGGLFGCSQNFFDDPSPNMAGHICGLYYLHPNNPGVWGSQRKCLPTVSQTVHARIVSSTSRTTLTQTYVNPSAKDTIPELRYTFPLFDGVSVVGFTCTINNDRIIRGVVLEKNTARKTYDKAVAKGETAGLFEQLPDSSDVFTTTIGNVPAGASINVDITYLGELKHDAEVDGIRLTIPTSVAPRFGSYPGTLMERPSNVSSEDGMKIIVDAEVPSGSVIKAIQSPSHPIGVSVGSTSTMAGNATPSLQFGSATLSLGTTELERDFIVQIIATNTSNPVAVLETHPTIPHQQAIMATLVPKFKLAAAKPEIVFICDRSGSMSGKINDLKKALKIYMKSLPVGCMFNICSFGSRHSFLFQKSRTYDQDTLDEAMKHIEQFDPNFGGTEMYGPIEDTFKRRHKDMDLEVFALTDGEIWNQGALFEMVNKAVEDSNGSIRLFTLGIGRSVSHSLIEGLARAGQGFSQSVSEQEKMSGKVVRMLKGALTPHIKDYSLEVKYSDAESQTEPEDDFEIVEPGSDKKESLDATPTEDVKKPISLFDTSAEDAETENPNAKIDGTGTDRFSHVSAVKPPKVMQAPFRIPPLYPYSRTNVYLLLSPDRAMRDKTPESVVLRGTSSQGPLELEIPITVLSDKGETIHQLAARKAVKELEEGRGWIYHAKARDGELLEKSHPGRFPSMVEREAVRLGVGFQVGGKWCSFVAVEDDTETKNMGNSAAEHASNDGYEDQTNIAFSGPPAGSVALAAGQEDMRRSNRSARAMMATRQAVSQPEQQQQPQQIQAQLAPFASRNSVQTRRMGTFGSSPPPPPPPGGGLFGSSPPTSSAFGSAQPFVCTSGGLFGGGPAASSPFGSNEPAPSGLFGSSRSSTLGPSPKARSSDYGHSTGAFGSGGASTQSFPGSQRPVDQAAALSAFHGPVDQELFYQHQRVAQDAAAMPVIDYSVDFDARRISASLAGAFLAETTKKKKVVSSSRPFAEAEVDEGDDVNGDELSALVSLQDFSGFWAWSPQLVNVLGISDGDMKRLEGVAADGNARATAVVVAFLRKKLADDRDSWEMMEDKAFAWLESELGDDGTARLVAVAETLF